ncbi:hypothetical protein DSO57_1007694 [Entomophthora muscae]|uniref:Uncharacterized protein n=1 Tax=Entomophthora muscae TaxID=34485 RepID=A0ACC2SW45_9FUNG|nr:hypothetical protein DSO57_1007694 [Entomophthora muscae]
MVLNPWTPLASSCPTPNLAKYVIPAVTLLYLAGSLRQYNILAKAFRQAMNLYPTIYALNGFEPSDLPSYRDLEEIPKHLVKIEVEAKGGGNNTPPDSFTYTAVTLSQWGLWINFLENSPIVATEFPDFPANISARIENSSSLETQAQEQESNPDPKPSQASGPVDQRTAHLRFAGIKPPQADTKNVGHCSETGQTKEIIAPNGRLITAPNGGTEAANISFMNLKSTPVANQEPSPESGTGPQPDPMTTTLKQVNQVANLISLTNERTPGLSAIFLPLNQSTKIPWTHISQCPDLPPMENIKFGGGVLYRPKDPALQTLYHFLIKLIQLLPYFIFAFYQISTRSHGTPAPPPAVSCPPGVPFGPVHFTDYPLKPKYKDYTPEKILKLDPLACI